MGNVSLGSQAVSASSFTTSPLPPRPAPPTSDDHLLLLCSSLQWQVFEEENRAAVRLLAGENVEISRSLDPGCINQFIPVDNFLHCRSANP